MLSARTRLAGPLPTFVATLIFAGAVAWALHSAWNPSISTYLDYVPIGAVFAAFLWDRFFPSASHNRRLVLCDIVVVTLALMRVFVPPLPFVSGHALFAGYSALTPRRWPLRVLAVAVLLHVVYVKLFVTGGLFSLLGGLAVAALLASARNGRTRFEPGPLLVRSTDL
jgi:hypothetical protein